MFLRNSTKREKKYRREKEKLNKLNFFSAEAKEERRKLKELAKSKKTEIENIITDIEEFKADPETTHLYEDENGATIVIHCDQNIYADYSGDNMLNWDLFEFIEDTYKMITKKNKPIKIRVIFPNTMMPKERKKIVSLIKMHYGIEYKETLRDIKKENLKGVISMIGGLLILVLGFVVTHFIPFMDNDIVSTIFEVFSTVLMWEAVGMFIFTNADNRVYLIKCLRLFQATIEY